MRLLASRLPLRQYHISGVTSACVDDRRAVAVNRFVCLFGGGARLLRGQGKDRNDR